MKVLTVATNILQVIKTIIAVLFLLFILGTFICFLIALHDTDLTELVESTSQSLAIALPVLGYYGLGNLLTIVLGVMSVYFAITTGLNVIITLLGFKSYGKAFKSEESLDLKRIRNDALRKLILNVVLISPLILTSSLEDFAASITGMLMFGPFNLAIIVLSIITLVKVSTYKGDSL